ncbi:hypothetical protein GGR57DRAFT_74854 [Xylariaceae sp. FL1272]|nr:hypothetical protein GGR57DRAFT_74854 [Xylariaceae sp. FL1272]
MDLRNVERLSSIQEGTEHATTASGHTRSRLASKSSRSTLLWPFHNRTGSDAPSTALSSRFGRLRSATFQSRSLFGFRDEETATIDRSIVPDYVINFMRGETPETLARKKEARQWGERSVTVTPYTNRESFLSHPVEMGYYYSSSITGLTNGANEDGRGSGQRDARRNSTGWRGGVLYNTILATLIFVVSLVGFVLVITKTKSISGELAIYSGACRAATQLNIGLHVVINVFGVVLLAGANYVFQVLASPTRDEMTAAHDNKRWLDIGVSSLRNFAHVSGFRATVGAIALLVAIAIQVISNAVISISQDGQDTCAVNVSTSTFLISLILNVVIVLSMAIILIIPYFGPIATLGDAIRSFLQIPDHSTLNTFLTSRADTRNGGWEPSDARSYTPKDHYWFLSPSFTRGVLTFASWIIVTGPTAAALAIMLSDSSANIQTPFGTATPSTTYLFPATLKITQAALLAALPQVLLSILYLAVNAILSTFFLSHELSLFALGPRPLRVSSNPSGAQTTSLYLSLPRPISWFLLAIFAALSFVLSQAIFPTTAESPRIPAIGFNTQALVVLLVLLVLLFIFVLALSLRRTVACLHTNGEAKGNPLALRGGSCSAVISAQCHYSRGEGALWLGPVAWGVVDGGRCAFSGQPVGVVEA